MQTRNQEKMKTSIEQGEGSGSKSCHQMWSKLVPSDLRYPEVELCSDEVEIYSKVKISSSGKEISCKITRNPYLSSATLQNKSLNVIFVDGTNVPREETVMISCGCEIFTGPASEGYLSYRFEVLPMNESPKKKLKISLHYDDAKCTICLNIWHDVVTVAPCLHNFCNGCFSEWLRRSEEKHSRVLCPHCRSIVQSVGRNHFLHSIEEEILQNDNSLRRSSKELATLSSYALIKSPLVIDDRSTMPIHSTLDEVSNMISMAQEEIERLVHAGPMELADYERVFDDYFQVFDNLMPLMAEVRSRIGQTMSFQQNHQPRSSTTSRSPSRRQETNHDSEGTS